MRVHIWNASFCLIIGSAVIIASFASQVLLGILVEIIGAFLGVFAAVALGETLKIREDNSIAKRVREDLIAELVAVYDKTNAHPDNPHAYVTTFWDATLKAGELGKLERDDRHQLVGAYECIKINNEVYHFCANQSSQPRTSREEKDYYSQQAAEAYRKMIVAVKHALEKLRE